MEPDVTAPSQCHFMRLSKELRLEIYEYLLRPEEILIRSYGSRSTLGLSEKEIAATKYYGEVLGDKWLSPQLLQASKTIYHEALPLLAKPHVLRLSPGAHLVSARMRKYERKVDVSMFSALRRAEHVAIRITTEPDTAIDDWEYSRVLAKQFSEELEVQNLHLTLDDVVSELGWEDDPRDPEDVTKLEDVYQMLRIWSKIRPQKGFMFSLMILGVERGLHWSWDTDKKSLEEWKQERGVINDSDDYDEQRLESILDGVKKAFPSPKTLIRQSLVKHSVFAHRKAMPTDVAALLTLSDWLQPLC